MKSVDLHVFCTQEEMKYWLEYFISNFRGSIVDISNFGDARRETMEVAFEKAHRLYDGWFQFYFAEIDVKFDDQPATILSRNPGIEYLSVAKYSYSDDWYPFWLTAQQTVRSEASSTISRLIRAIKNSTHTGMRIGPAGDIREWKIGRYSDGSLSAYKCGASFQWDHNPMSKVYLGREE